MELLVILLGEFLFIPFIAAAAAVVSLSTSLIGSLFELYICWPNRALPGIRREDAMPSPEKRSFRVHRVVKVSGGIFASIVVISALANLFFFEPTVRLIAAQAAQQKGIQLSFTSAQGNLFTGLVEIRGLTAKTANGRKTDYDIRSEHVLVDVDVLSLLFSPVIIERVVVEGVSGSVTSKPPPQANTANPEPLKAKKSFVIKDLSVQNVSLKLLKGEANPLTLTLRSIKSQPFRSQYAIFDIFFRSSIRGDLDGHDIMIFSQASGEGRETHWQLNDFPVAVIAQYVDKAPINWFTRGSMDVRVSDSWAHGERAEIDMDWSLILQDVRVEPPASATLLQKTLSAPIVNYINGREGPVDLSFSLRMNQDDFQSASSLDAAGLWDAAIESLALTLAKATGDKVEAAKDGVKGGVEAFKDFLDSKRQKPEGP